MIEKSTRQERTENLKIWIIYISSLILISFILIVQIIQTKPEEIVLPNIEKIPIVEEEIIEEDFDFVPHIIHNMEVVTQPEIDMTEVTMLAQLIQSEAGNQSYIGRVLVADVVLNRVESEKFPNTIEAVIFQKNPVQFSVTTNGAYNKAGKNLNEENIEIAKQEMTSEKRYNSGILYFGTGQFNGSNFFKEDGHWFSY